MPSKNSKKKTGYAPSGPSRAALAEREERDFRLKRENDVKRLIEEWRFEYGHNWRLIVQKKFTAISVEYLVKTDDDLFIPGEIGICSYTLDGGVSESKMHAFIRPDSIPLGYTADAKSHSEQRHKIPYAGLDNGITDYELIMNEVNNILETKISDPTAFCLADEYKQINSSLKYLNNNRDHNIRLICVEDLLHALCEWQTQQSLHRLETLKEINDTFSRAVHDFAPSIRCMFHDDPAIDIPHCSIATVHRIWYHTTNFLCESYNITPTAKHLPSTSNTFHSIQQPFVACSYNSSKPAPPPTIQVPVFATVPAAQSILQEQSSSEYCPALVFAVDSTSVSPFYQIEEPMVSRLYQNVPDVPFILSNSSLQTDYSQYCDEELVAVQFPWPMPPLPHDFYPFQQGTPAVPVFLPSSPSADRLPSNLISTNWHNSNIGFRRRLNVPFDGAPLQRSRGPNVGKKYVRPGVNA